MPPTLPAAAGASYTSVSAATGSSTWGIRFISRVTRARATTTAALSAMGPAYMTPSIPRKRGKIKIRGMRKITCRVRAISAPRLALPMEVKKLAVMGWKALASVINI